MKTDEINARCLAGVKPCEPGCKRFGRDRPPAPPPPTENARAGADEAEAIAQQAAMDVMADWPMNVQPVLRMGVRDKVLSAARKAEAAGRARGIEETSAKVMRLCDPASFWDCWEDLAEAIADAIAKETP